MNEAQQTLMQFPCEITIKVMLRNSVTAVAIAKDIVSQHTKVLQTSQQFSRNDSFVSVNLRVPLDNEQQLKDIYQQLRQHPKILMSL